MIVVAAIAASLVLLGMALVVAYLAVHHTLRRAFRALNPAYLWFTGLPIGDGKSRTNAGWLVRSHGPKPVFHESGRAVWFHHQPRLLRAAIRTGSSVMFLGVLAGIGLATQLTLIILAVLFVASAVLAGWWLVRKARGWRHQRHYVKPLAGTIVSKIPIAPSKVTVKRDGDTVQWVDVEWPPETELNAGDQQAVLQAVTDRLPLEAPNPTWRLKGRERQVRFTPCDQPPPRLVTWDEIASDVARLKPDELLVGLGKKRQLVTVSLKDDSPHFLISMGTGAGKSTTAAFWVVQALMRGDIVLFLDPKQHSHPWAFKDMNAEFDQLPNVAYVRRPKDLHDAMAWLGNELDARNRIATMGMNSKGEVIKGDVGPRIFVICEEVNLAEGPLKQYWAENRDPDVDPKKSPAFTGLGAVAFAGRAVKMHLVVIGQMVTANVLGGGSVRENMGVRCLARYTQNSWKMQAGDIPMPPPPTVIGRIQCIASGEVREAQVPFVDIEADTSRLRELAMSGIVTPCPPGMPGAAPGRELVGAAVPFQRNTAIGGPDLRLSNMTGGSVPSAGPPTVTLTEAVADGIVGPTIAAVRKARSREDGFPEPVGERRGRGHPEKEYKVSDLYAWDRDRIAKARS